MKRLFAKHRRKLQIMYLSAVSIMLVLACISLYFLLSVDSRYIRDMERGLDRGWQQKHGELELQEKKKGSNTKFLNEEYASVKKYKDKKFRDKNLKKLSNEYIAAVEDGIKVSKKYDPGKDFDKFWEAFSDPYSRRLAAIYRIYKGRYGLELRETDSKGRRNYMLAQGWAINKADSIEFTQNVTQSDGIYYEAKANNDSGFNLEYLDFEVELLDKDGNIQEKASALAQDIKKGADFTLKFYQVGKGDVSQYRIVSEVCRIRTPKKAKTD